MTQRALYDQDLHVHHRNYQRVGAELDSDLRSLCRRCHEIETFGESSLPAALDLPAQELFRLVDTNFVVEGSEEYLDGWNDAWEYCLWLCEIGFLPNFVEGQKRD